MMGGAALASRAIGDAARRDIAPAWGGPEPAAPQMPLPAVRESTRRMRVRKP